MENIVAVKVIDAEGKSHYFLAWGRVFDAVDAEPLLEAIRPHLTQWGIRDCVSIELCRSLSEAASQPYFYEALFDLSQQKIPYGKKYEAW